MIRVEKASLSVGGHDILSDAVWHLRPGEHVGLVGRNGAGKTTLLRALEGELSPDDGRIERRSGIRVATLPQHAVSGSSATVWEEARSGMVRIGQLRTALERVQAQVESGDEDAIAKLDVATEAFRQAGGYAEDERIGTVLHGLGFGPDTWHNPCDTFSGGWQMRIALARLLLSDPDVALLDEPTNHLDIEARSWLAGYLQRWNRTLVVVSHDRHLLDKVTTRIAEVRRGKLHIYKGNFSAFLNERENRRVAHETAFDRQQEEIAKLERFVTRFKAKATKAAQARSRVKQLDRMERIDSPERYQPLPKFKLPEAPPGDFEAIKVVNADVGWTDEPVLRGVDFVLERGMRIASLGPNGCGKSTLLQAMAGRIRPLAGRCRAGDRVRIGVFTQDLASELPDKETALQHLSDQAPTVKPERIRAILGALGLSGDAALREIGSLSGGERARVALAGLAIRPHNVLLLDEPTNHLDIETVEVLVRALKDFEGAMMVVTHDRYLVEQLATHVARVGNGRVEMQIGVRPTDFERMAPDQSQKRESKGESYAERKRIQRERERAVRRIAELEDLVEAGEAELETIDGALFEEAANYDRARELSAQREAMQQQIDANTEEWERLLELVEETPE